MPLTLDILDKNKYRYLAELDDFLGLDAPELSGINEKKKIAAATKLNIHLTHLSNLHLDVSQSLITTACLGLVTAGAALAFPPAAAGVALIGTGITSLFSARSLYLQNEIRRAARPLRQKIYALLEMIHI